MTPYQNADFLRALRRGATVMQLTVVTGLSRQAVSRHLAAMHDKRIAHITSWASDSLGRLTIATWRIGTKKDAPKPGHKTDAERQRSYRQRRQRQKAKTAL
jgi:DNA-binding transcriptional ArsR family regulator